MSLESTFSLKEPLRSSCIAYISAYLVDDPNVWHIDFSRRPELFNYRARSIINSGTVGMTLTSSPYTSANLRGYGQVVSVADTGVDVQSCFFYDPTGNIAANSIFSPVTNRNLRKIIQYSYLPGCGDNGDIQGGHGTHVCGTIAGNNLNNDITQGILYVSYLYKLYNL